MIVLALSTSSPRGTVAIARDGAIAARVAYDGGTSHAERLFAAIDEAMAQAVVTRADLAGLACDIGPGSFTGVRVGIASAKGIALALGLPVVGIGSLESMAGAAIPEAAGRPVLAVVDARKGEVFAAVYDTPLSPVWGPEHLPRTDVARLIDLAAQHDAIVVSEMTLDGLRIDLRSDAADLPDAASMAILASTRLASVSDAVQRFDAGSLEALYVRAPDAKPLSEQR